MFTYRLLLASILLSCIGYLSADDPHWDYGLLGPDVWKDLYPWCGGSSQSPINIQTACSTYQTFPSFEFSPSYYVTQEFVSTNNGHTIVSRQTNASAYPLILTGGGLEEPFTFVNLHLHWGENYKSGSEHQLNGEKYAGEIHFVHINAEKTQYAVLAMFMESEKPAYLTESEPSQYRRQKRRVKKRDIPGTDNSTLLEWDDYFLKAEGLQQTSNTTLMSLTLSTLMGRNLDKFYRYSGSFTTPPCTESVTWTVFETPVKFTDAQLTGFRTRVFPEGYRGPQPLYGRAVYRNFPNTGASPRSNEACCVNADNQTSTKRFFSIEESSVAFMNKQSVWQILFLLVLLLLLLFM